MMNKVFLIGRITRDLSAKTTNSGISNVGFSIAVDRKFKDVNGEKQTDFINCVAWRNTADFIVKYFKKGSKIVIVGSIQTRNYDDKDGKKIYATEVVVDEVEFAESKQTSGGGNYDNISTAYQPAAGVNNLPEGFTVVDDTELPFDLGI